MGKHRADEIFGFPLVVSQHGKVGEVVEALDDVGFAHISSVPVKRVVAACENVVEDASEGEYVDGTGSAAVGLGVDDGGFGCRSACVGGGVVGRVGVEGGACEVGVDEELRGAPTGCAGCVGCGGAEGILVAFKFFA